jgi:hypothetical protein
MRPYPRAGLAAIGSIVLALGGCSSTPEPRDVTPSTTPSASKGAADDTSGGPGGAGPDSMFVAPDTAFPAPDTATRGLDSLRRPSDTARGAPAPGAEIRDST